MTPAPTPGPAEADRIDAAKALFDEHSTMTLAASVGGEPWVAMVYFVDDEPLPGRLDVCCALVASSRARTVLGSGATVAFMVAGARADRWLRGAGVAEEVADEADAAAIFKRLGDKVPDAESFFAGLDAAPVRIHVRALRLTDMAADPPVAEFSFD